MLENVASQSNVSKSGIELKKKAKKEIEIFLALYLKMGLMKGYCVRAYWAAETRYPPVADEMTSNRFELLARHIHFCDKNAMSEEGKQSDIIWKVRNWVDGFRENLTKIPLQHGCGQCMAIILPPL
ncbi:PiggyBac transposable element-derived protein 3 [Plakobranchus ocellatus]|uniref:PiggyBac transposable element-derived protein 3 n=1 Tax=Plakobranchus ocellatus TaxID=259542 RepID=A0AAV3Y817_9GAST|nr:PiggyBac transposable element-derived protein 3 [Plakobranchus ocellatus]